MPNYRRNYVPGGTFFFTVTTHRRRPLLVTPLGRRALRDALISVRERLPFTIDAIVLLPDHLHCILTLPRNDFDFSIRWRQVKSLFTRSWLSGGGNEVELSRSRVGKGERGVWQRRGFEHTCRDEEDMKRCIDYIHVNPLKHGLVERVYDWPWSSFHRYVEMGEYTIDWGSANEWHGDEWRHFE